MCMSGTEYATSHKANGGYSRGLGARSAGVHIGPAIPARNCTSGWLCGQEGLSIRESTEPGRVSIIFERA